MDGKRQKTIPQIEFKKRPIIKTLSGAVKRRFKTVDIYGGSL